MLLIKYYKNIIQKIKRKIVLCRIYNAKKLLFYESYKELSKLLSLIGRSEYNKVMEYIFGRSEYNKVMEYIWHCPRKQSCGAIVLKTKEPILPLDKSYKCKRCNVVHSSESLILANKKNIKKYLDEIEKRLKE